MSGTVVAGTELTSALLGVPPWTAMAGSYLNSWSDFGAGFVTGQYRLWKLLNEVEFIGAIQHTSISGTSIFFQLPVGMRPVTNQEPCQWGAGGAVIGNLTVDTSGNLTLNGMSAATALNFHGWVSLDA